MDKKKITKLLMYLFCVVTAAVYIIMLGFMYSNIDSTTQMQQSLMSISLCIIAVVYLPLEALIYFCAKQANMKKSQLGFGIAFSIHCLLVIASTITYIIQGGQF